MAVVVGSARSSYGDTSPGDQHGGKEVSTQSWYLHKLGWRVFRPKSSVAAGKIARAMKAACANNNIGYDQGTRDTLYNAVKNLGFDPSKCSKKVNTDCSALVRVCCAYAGITLPSFTTGRQPKVLLDSGAFVEMEGDKYTTKSDYLMAGDVLVTATKGHTVIVLTDGPKAEKPASDTVEILPGTWNLRAGHSTSYEAIGCVHGGDTVAVLEIDSASGWYRVKVTDTKSGWISPKAVNAAGLKLV